MSLHRDEEHAKKVLWEEFGVRPHAYYFDNIDFRGDESVIGRIRGVTVVYPNAGEYENLLGKVVTAIMNAVDDVGGILYAGYLKFELEDLGIYGVSIWDARDKTIYKLLTRTIATGRLRSAYERGWLSNDR